MSVLWPQRAQAGGLWRAGFIVTRGQVPLGWFEAKDVGKPLDDIEKANRSAATSARQSGAYGLSGVPMVLLTAKGGLVARLAALILTAGCTVHGRR